jgi:hypothetical protein
MAEKLCEKAKNANLEAVGEVMEESRETSNIERPTSNIENGETEGNGGNGGWGFNRRA